MLYLGRRVAYGEIYPLFPVFTPYHVSLCRVFSVRSTVHTLPEAGSPRPYPVTGYEIASKSTDGLWRGGSVVIFVGNLLLDKDHTNLNMYKAILITTNSLYF